MQKTVTWFAAAVLLAVAVSGCSGGDGAPRDDAPGIDVVATETTGAIRGVVVDAAIRPIVAATVSLSTQSGPLNATTNEAGAFGFSSLAPGTYFVKASKPRFLATQASVEVVAGVAEPDVVKILLDVDPAKQASVDILGFEGFIECSISLVIFVIPACEGIGNDHYTETFNITGRADFIQVEIVWEASTPTGDELYTNVDTTAGDNLGFGGGTSPLVVDITKDDAAALEGEGLVVSVFANGQAADVGATIEQRFQVFIVVTHGFVPAEGYLFSTDGAPPVPE